LGIQSTIHLVYVRYYNDPEDGYPFGSYHTIFRNVNMRHLHRLNDNDFKKKVCKIMDKKYKETAENFAGTSEVQIMHGSEYYETYEDRFGEVAEGDKTLFNDYGQLWNTRQGFKYDFNEQITNKYKPERIHDN